MKPIVTTWRKCLRRILKIPYNSHCNLLAPAGNVQDISYDLHKHFVKFFSNATNSDNKLVRLCGRMALEGSCSVVCESLNFISHHYNIDKNKLHCHIISPKAVPGAVTVTSGLLHDLIEYCEDHPSDHNIKDLIDEICVDLCIYMLCYFLKTFFL